MTATHHPHAAMPRRTFLAALAAAALAGCANATRRDPDERVDELMRRYQGKVPGASLLVLRDGHPAIRKSYGYADLENVVAAMPATNYRLASMTKEFTAASILLLAEDGKLALDDRARKWLPSLPGVADAITLRHLLTHTGGLIDYEDVMPQSPPEPAPLPSASALPPTSAESVPESDRQLRDADVLRLIEKTDKLYFAPGTSYRYSNTGYAMLALIVERASGKPFQDFLRERIFVPLGMRDTLARVHGGPPVSHRAYGYSEIGGRWLRTDQSLTSAVLGDGGIYSSIDDLAKWDAALYDARLLRDESRRAAFTPWTRTDEADVEYGYGWRITGETLWHSGETIGFRNVIVRWPRRRTSVILLSNRDDPEPYRTALATGQLYLPAG
ncbi:MAG: serine hydrolase domain-containing protein [Rudaea sp.]|uniref:serine hydrolase domain-containing protein n=1 Tax=Rudaea sp. TaxID=2136325 RepID=UPI0039E39F9B